MTRITTAQLSEKISSLIDMVGDTAYLPANIPDQTYQQPLFSRYQEPPFILEIRVARPWLSVSIRSIGGETWLRKYRITEHEHETN